MTDVLHKLSGILEQRKQADPQSSYVAKLHRQGLNKILEKVGEEATEVILAAKDARDDRGREELTGEVADLLFHCMVMLSHLDLDIGRVLECLDHRFGVSGLEEKASRTDSTTGHRR